MVGRHDAEEGIRTLTSRGSLPSEFEAVQAAAFARQDEADAKGGLPVDHIYDVPAALSKVISGHRHDDVSGPVKTALGVKKNIVLALFEWLRSEGWDETADDYTTRFRSPVDAEWSIAIELPSVQAELPRGDVAAVPYVGILHTGLTQMRMDLLGPKVPALSPRLPLGALLGMGHLVLCGEQYVKDSIDVPVREFEQARNHLSAGSEVLRGWCNPRDFTRAFSLLYPRTMNLLPDTNGRLVADAYFGWDSYSDAFLADPAVRPTKKFQADLKKYLAAHPPDPTKQRTEDPHVPASEVVTPAAVTSTPETPPAPPETPPAPSETPPAPRDASPPEPGASPSGPSLSLPDPKPGVVGRLFKRKR